VEVLLFIIPFEKENQTPEGETERHSVRHRVHGIEKEGWPEIEGKSPKHGCKIVFGKDISEPVKSKHTKQAGNKSEDTADDDMITEYFEKYCIDPFHQREFHPENIALVAMVIYPGVQDIHILFSKIVDHGLGFSLPPFMRTLYVHGKYMPVHDGAEQRQSNKYQYITVFYQ
jgi:hypothetical protein